ncbi:MAG: endolytic transglycosylase MltG, partial [Gaiellales bacterium]
MLAAYEGARSALPDSSKPAASPHGPLLRVVIPPGTTAVGIGQILERTGVVSDGGRFRDYAKSQGQGADFKAGTYMLRAGEDYDAIIRLLDAGPAPPTTSTLVVPEGFRITQIEQRLQAVNIDPAAYRRALAATHAPPGFGSHRSMEGFLFPATYRVRPGETPRTLISQQLGALENAFSQVDMSYARSKNLTPYDVLTIASMIEREAKVERERPLIAAVIYNRLHLHMTLGIDATLLYQYGSWTHQLTVSELAADTPYNTRVRYGL